MIGWHKRLIIIVCIVMAICIRGFAFEMESEEVPVIVNGDKVEYFAELEKVSAEGNVVIEYGKTTLTCDKIVVFTKTKDGFAEGNVELRDEKGLIRGKSLTYNFETQEGKITGADLKMAPYFCLAPKAEKFPSKFVLYNAEITTCNLDQPHYHMYCRKVDIYPKDKIHAQGVKFVVGSVPVLYLPFFTQRIDDPRHGFSFQPGSSKEWGSYLLTAYRYYLNEEVRGILRVDYRANKGFAYGFDMEKFAGDFGNAHLEYYFIKESLHGRGETEPIYKKPKRYKLEYRHKWDIDNTTQFITEIHDFSDKNLLRNYFYRQFEIDPAPRSYTLFSHNYPNATASILLQKRFNHFFSETEKIPEVKLDTRKFQLMDSPLYYQNDSSITGFTTRAEFTDADEDTVRVDTFNELSYPFKAAIFNLEPSVGIRNSYYSKDKNGSEQLLRNIFYSGCSISTKFYRTFEDVHLNAYGIEIDKLRHIITPSLSHQFINEPTLPAERLTAFDSIDSIVKTNQTVVSLENKLQTKRAEGAADLLRFIVSSPYDYKLEGHGGRFGDITLDLELLPNSWLKFNSDAHFDFRRKSFRDGNFDLTFPLADNNGSISAGYRYTATGEDDNKLLTFAFERFVNPKWKLRTYHRVELTKGTVFEEQEYALVRDLHCWEVEFVVNAKQKQGTTFFVAFRCKAFPDLGFDFSKQHQGPKNP